MFKNILKLVLILVSLFAPQKKDLMITKAGLISENQHKNYQESLSLKSTLDILTKR